MPSRNKPISFRPIDGGMLDTRSSSELPSFSNYVVKRDWRREHTDEMRREGEDFFHPNLTIDIGNQPYPQIQDSIPSGFRNGGFETDTNNDGIPDNWDASVAATMTYDMDTASVHAGTFSSKFTGTNTLDIGALTTDEFKVTVGDRMIISYWIRSDSLFTKVEAKITFLDAGGSLVENVDLPTIMPGSVPPMFTQFSNSVTVPPNSVLAKVRITVYGPTVGGPKSVWVDDVSVIHRSESHKPITLLHQAKRPNGEMAVIAGIEETIYRYNASNDGEYYEEVDDGGYFTTGEDYIEDYFNEDGDPIYIEDYYGVDEGSWSVIGTGFAVGARRWEAVNINGYAVFNNGADLPQTFRVEDGELFPNYEMREAGIAFVGTIWEYNGVLFGGDVAVLRQDRIKKVFAHESGGVQQIYQNGSPVQDGLVRAKTGFAINLDGVNDYVAVADSASLDVASVITLEVWLKLDSFGTVSTILHKERTSATDYVYSLHMAAGALTFGLYSAAAVHELTTGFAPFQIGKWAHIAAVYDGSFMKIFIDGALNTSLEITLASITTSARGLTIGGNSTTGASVDGLIAEARVWNVARSQDEIIANKAKNVTGQTGLVGFWRFDAGTGVTAADESGNANTGTLTSGTTWAASTAPVDSYIQTTPYSAIVNGLTRVGTTAMFVSALPHRLSTGDKVVISGATGAAYNGFYTVTVVDPFTFTYIIVGAPATPDPGSPIVQRALFGDSYLYKGYVGKRLFALNGYNAHIVEVPDKTYVKTDKDVSAWVGDHVFHIIIDDTYDINGSVAKNGTITVTGTGTFFQDELVPGMTIRIPGGIPGDEFRVIAAIASNTSLTVTSAFAGTASAQILSSMGSYLLLSNTDYFTDVLLNRYIFFDDGSFRQITDVIGPRIAQTTYHLPVVTQTFLIENITAYGRISDPGFYDRVQYRTVWGVIDEPTRWAASVPGSIEVGQFMLELDYQARSFKVGQEIIIVGAGELGGNLIATIVYIHPNHTSFAINKRASTTVASTSVARSDAIGSMAGFDDLQDDGSAIIKGLKLRGVVVVYKDTAIYIGQYTGRNDDPFAFSPTPIVTSNVPFYPSTLISINDQLHLYAGRNCFYTFDLTARIPREFTPLERCSPTFYDQARLENVGLIFCAHNVLTKEILLAFPSTSEDKGLLLDYQYGTVSTTAMWYTAACSIKAPQAGPVVGPANDWFILGSNTGTVSRYGKSDVPEVAWGGAMAIFNRFGSGYDSKLKSGLWGDRFYETLVSEWMAELSSRSYPNTTGLHLNLYGYRNSVEQPALLLVSTDLPLPATGNLVPVWFEAHFFQDEIVVSGVNNPIRIAARSAAFSKVASRGQQKAGIA